jgi:muramoyltetrapeptide carboxypeptidase LdcA involved in peptidoglycan recycling
MLQQLRLAGVFAHARGLAFGLFPNCTDRSGNPELVHRVVAEFARELGLPSCGRMPFGHGPGVQTVALGTIAVLDHLGILYEESPTAVS